MDLNKVLEKVGNVNINIDTKSAEEIGKAIQQAKIKESENELEAVRIKGKFEDEERKRDHVRFFFGAIVIPIAVGFVIISIGLILKSIPPV